MTRPHELEVTGSAAYHVANPAPGLDGAGDVANDALLLFAVVLGVVLLLWTYCHPCPHR